MANLRLQGALFILLLALGLALAGCRRAGGTAAPTPTGSAPTDTAITPPSDTPQPTATLAPTATDTPTATSGLALADRPAISAENVLGLQFLMDLEGSLVFSPDMGTLALLEATDLRVLDSATLSELGRLACASEFNCPLSFSADGQLLAWNPAPGVVGIWDRASASEQAQWSGFSDNCCGQIQFSPDGQRLAVLDGPSLRLWDLASQSETAAFENVLRAHFSPDGAILAYESAEAIEVVLWDIAAAQEIRRLSGFETAAPVYMVQFSPDWQRLIWIARATAQIMQLDSGALGPPLALSLAVFSPDGQLLAGTEQGWGEFPCTAQLCLFNAASGVQLATLPQDEIFWSLAFSPDGRLLVTVVGGQVRLWDVQGQNLLLALDPGSDEIAEARFSPDGRLLIVTIPDGPTRLWAAP